MPSTQNSITFNDAQLVVSQVDRVRLEFPKSHEQPGRVDPAILQRLLDSLPNSSPGLQRVHELGNDYLADRSNKLWVIREPIGGEQSLEFVLSYMRPSKASGSFFEAMIIENVAVDPDLLIRFPSQATPIQIHGCTQGIANDKVLGIFPERLGLPNPPVEQESNAPAWYLIDRFASRFNRVTRPALQVAMPDRLKADLCSALRDPDWVTNAAIQWLVRHEHFHGTGPLPFRQYKFAKRGNDAPGLEELRVDLLSIRSCYKNNRQLTNDEAALVQYVLAERLLAYALVDLAEGAKQPSFDTVGSQYLLIRLVDAGLVHIDTHRLQFTSDIREMAEVTLDHIERFEEKTASLLRNFDEGVPFGKRRQQSGIRKRFEAEVNRVTQLLCPALPRTPMRNGWLLLNFYRDLWAELNSKTVRN